MKKLSRSSVLAIALAAAAALSRPASAAEDLTVTFDTSTSSGPYEPENYVVVWLEDESGRFVRTLGRWGDQYWYDLRAWQNACGFDADAVTAATLVTYGTLSATSDIGTFPDGTYKVQMELTDWELPTPGLNNRAAFTFDKDGTAQALTPGDQGGFSNVTITYAGRTAPGDSAPGVYAGPDQRTDKMAVILDGAAADDGLPTGTLTTTWSRLSGPGAITFEDASALETAVAFTQGGTHVLELEADDTVSQTTDEVTVVVHATVLNPVADAHVRGGANASFNYNVPWIDVENKDGGGVATAEGYVRFDVSGVTATITSATLRLAHREFYRLGSTTRNVNQVADDSWTETGINWNNRPAAGAQIAQYTPDQGWMEMDVTAYVLAEKAGDGLASLNMAAPSSTDYSSFNSRDAHVPPELLLMTASPADTDGDGMPDQWETDNGTSPGVADASADPDEDNFSNLREYAAGTNPLNPDTDGDGLLDGDDPDPLTPQSSGNGGGGGCGAASAIFAALVLLALRRRS